jgi:hypothetical protein
MLRGFVEKTTAFCADRKINKSLRVLIKQSFDLPSGRGYYYVYYAHAHELGYIELEIGKACVSFIINPWNLKRAFTVSGTRALSNNGGQLQNSYLYVSTGLRATKLIDVAGGTTGATKTVNNGNSTE